VREARKALIAVPLFVCSLIGIAFSVGYLLAFSLKTPFSLGFSLIFRVFGLLLLFLSASIMGWVFRYRRPEDIAVSTYITLLRALRRKTFESSGKRTEPLVVQGPYKYTRNPMYLGVILGWTGLWLALDFTPLLFSAVFVFLFLYFIVIPFEEKELREMFGEQYEEYARKVRRLIPFLL